MSEEEYKIEVMLTIDDLKLLRDSLKGTLVRENSMNFEYLKKITKLGYFIEEVIKQENGG
jgi:hypothetical protein